MPPAPQVRTDRLPMNESKVYTHNTGLVNSSQEQTCIQRMNRPTIFDEVLTEGIIPSFGAFSRDSQDFVWGHVECLSHIPPRQTIDLLVEVHSCLK